MSPVGPTTSRFAGSGDLPATYSRCVERTRASIQARLATASGGAIVRDYFLRGKMIRAHLVFASAGAVGGRPDDVVVAAEAIELLHGASLFHDDIIDRAGERRGLAALHERLGVGAALVIGDELLLRALAVLGEAQAGHPAAVVAAAAAALNELARECCRGQFEELQAGRWISEADYLAIAARKTAAPFVAAATLGALLGGGTETHLARLRVYAREIGVAFQIADDLLDLIGSSARLGKPAGNSLALGRPMLPLIYLREVSAPAGRCALDALGGDEAARGALLAQLADHGILDRVARLHQRHVERALAALVDFPGAAGLEALQMLALVASAGPAAGPLGGSAAS